MVTVQRVKTLGYHIFYSIFTVEPERMISVTLWFLFTWAVRGRAAVTVTCTAKTKTHSHEEVLDWYLGSFQFICPAVFEEKNRNANKETWICICDSYRCKTTQEASRTSKCDSLKIGEVRETRKRVIRLISVTLQQVGQQCNPPSVTGSTLWTVRWARPAPLLL